MTLRTLFEKQVLIRLTGDQTAFVCTTKWPLLSRSNRVEVRRTGGGLAPQETEPVSIARQALRRIRIE